MASKERLARYGKIHVTLDALGWDEERYRDVMYGLFEETSKTKLSIEQLDRFIQVLRARLVDAGALPPAEVDWGWGTQKYEALSGRSGDFANPSQLRKVEATWREVARTPSDDALQSFIQRIAGVDHLVWLKQEDVKPVLIALKKMKEKKEHAAQGAARATPTMPQPTRPGTSRPASIPERSADFSQLSQARRILWHLYWIGAIDNKQAQDLYGVGRLAARIYDLRHEDKGARPWPIRTREKKVTDRFGTERTVAEYTLTLD